MQKPKSYTDIDYDSFPVPDLDQDIHWTLLPISVWDEQQKASREKLNAERLAAQPPDHQVILVPSDPDSAPCQEDVWPILNHAIQSVLKKHPAVHTEVIETISRKLDDFRGWRNPYPCNLDYPNRPIWKRAA